MLDDLLRLLLLSQPLSAEEVVPIEVSSQAMQLSGQPSAAHSSLSGTEHPVNLTMPSRPQVRLTTMDPRSCDHVDNCPSARPSSCPDEEEKVNLRPIDRTVQTPLPELEESDHDNPLSDPEFLYQLKRINDDIVYKGSKRMAMNELAELEAVGLLFLVLNIRLTHNGLVKVNPGLRSVIPYFPKSQVEL
ncbi:hypothetical protein TRICI_000792 [Trichomonascus ciferrii]|uniref:Uncharacterized protein n=1 Tax=Trichomonascus ciferrii TaxID=44093 RepID=A0A642VCY1_9ASCO|nr:hypothetical protein TRICI_000792 [Trichomonascus ciferrii]